MDWFPIVAVTFKFLVLGTGMFFAIKWHYDQGKKKRKEMRKEEETRAVLRATAKIAALFVLLLVGLVLGTFALARRLGLDLSFS